MRQRYLVPRPTLANAGVTIVPNETPTTSTTMTFTLTFDEPTVIVLGDLTGINATLSSLVGGGTSYTVLATSTRTDTGVYGLSYLVAGLTFQIIATNPIPTVTGPATHDMTPFSVTIAFDQGVTPAVTAADLDITNGTGLGSVITPTGTPVTYFLPASVTNAVYGGLPNIQSNTVVTASAPIPVLTAPATYP